MSYREKAKRILQNNLFDRELTELPSSEILEGSCLHLMGGSVITRGADAPSRFEESPLELAEEIKLQINPQVLPDYLQNPISIEIPVNIIHHNQREFILNKHIPIQVKYSEGSWIYSNHEFEITARGKNKEEAMSDFSSCFAFLWDEYGQEEDEELTSGALKLKEGMLALVGSIVKTEKNEAG